MNITLSGTKVTVDNRTLAFAKNNLVNEIVVTVDTSEDWTYRINVKYSKEDCSGKNLYNVINLSRVGDVCSVLLTNAMLPFSGKYIMQIVGKSGQREYHSDVFDVWAKYSIDPSEVYDPVPSEFYQIEDNIIEINNHPPYPDTSGYWMIWNPDTHQYELSTIPVPTEGGGDKTYVHNQVVASKTWEITHNLYKQPSVTIVDSGGNTIVGEVEYTNLNSLVCTFSSPFSGKAYLN